MRKLFKYMLVGSLLTFGSTACADLEVANLNDPDAARSLATPGDVISLIGGSYNNWYYGNYSYNSAGMAISNAVFQHNAPWANAGMEKYGRLPRIGFINSISDGDYNYMVRSWFYSYRAIAAVADGLKSLADPEIGGQLDADEVAAATAFAKFVQGMSHATIAVLFSKGFVVDETTDLLQPQDPLPYDELMDVAMGYFDEAIQLSSGASWSIPLNWMQIALTGPELAEVAYSMKARYMASNARTVAERQALNWTEIMGWIDDGITADLVPFYDDYGGWSNDVLGYGTYFGWSQMAYFIFGMADQSGMYQDWNALSLGDKSYQIVVGSDTTQVLIVTPDTRFPQGATVEDQRATTGSYFRINTPSETGGVWARPDRGTWRWSWYKHSRGGEYWIPGDTDDFYQAEIRVEEMNLLKAEGLYYQGDLAGAAAIVNETRTLHGLNATDAAGTNTSCVPKLPNGSCGDLWEMLKWEKRMENTFRGPLGVGWYFDARGWGDLWKDTFLHLPIPCAEAQVLQLLPCESAGGPGGTDGAPLSTYAWNGEG